MRLRSEKEYQPVRREYGGRRREDVKPGLHFRAATVGIKGN
jgi:hypothetical protein